MAHVQARDGTSIHYDDWGAGPPVVLIHGWPVHADMWEYQAGHLVDAGYRVVSYDRRGFGRSGRPWTGYDYDTMTDDLATLIEHLDLTGATLVGFSMGGGEVARYAARDTARTTARVAKVVFLSAVCPFLLQTPENPSGVDRATFDQMIEGLEADRPHFLAAFGRAFYGAGLLNFSVSAELLQWTSMMALTASKRATLECVRAFSETDFRGELARIDIPALVIHGTADQIVPIDASGRLTARLLPNATLIEYDGAPHGLYFTEQDRLNTDLVDFIR